MVFKAMPGPVHLVLLLLCSSVLAEAQVDMPRSRPPRPDGPGRPDRPTRPATPTRPSRPAPAPRTTRPARPTSDRTRPPRPARTAAGKLEPAALPPAAAVSPEGNSLAPPLLDLQATPADTPSPGAAVPMAMSSGVAWIAMLLEAAVPAVETLDP